MHDSSSIISAQTPESLCHEALRYWRLEYIKPLGGRENMHWLVESQGCPFVLRRYAAKPFGDINYEIKVMQMVHDLGWPVPVAVDVPVQFGGRDWCLLTWCCGNCGKNDSSDQVECRKRGQLLANLHDSLTNLAIIGQREGCCRSDILIRDAELIPLINAYTGMCPSEGHVLRWHHDIAEKAFSRIAIDTAETIILHGDFTPWNLLFEHDQLTGILDFEFTHLNFRVADFANTWRGMHNAVIDGYQDVHKLDDVDMDLLVPVYWSWLFIGLKNEIRSMLSGAQAPHGFKWRIDHLLRRTTVMERRMPDYPGPKGKTVFWQNRPG